MGAPLRKTIFISQSDVSQEANNSEQSTDEYSPSERSKRVPCSKSLATLRRQKQPTRRPTTKVNPRFNERKNNSYSANSDDEDASRRLQTVIKKKLKRVIVMVIWKEEVKEKEEPRDTSETIEKEKGDPNIECDPNEKKTQFLIKWKDSVGAWCNQMTPEDSEYYECQLELQQDLLKSYNIVERIIKFRDSEGSKKKKTPSKACRALNYRPKFVQLSEEPEYFGGYESLWAPDINIVTYIGDVEFRNTIRETEWCYESSKRLKFNAILTTWAVLLVDEVHHLKNDDSLLYKTLQNFNTNQRLLITGTPLQNNLKELFDNWVEFEHMHDNAASKGCTKLYRQLETYIRRVKKDVEQILSVGMTPVQRKYYKWFLTKNFNALRKGSKGSLTTSLNIMIKLKKCCNHALLTEPQENENTADDNLQSLLQGSGKLMLLDYSCHLPFQRLDGSQDFCFLLSTRAGGLDINLATSDTVIIFDSDWNPQNDLQAQAHAHRIGQKNQVNIYQLVTKGSIEEDINGYYWYTGHTVLDKKANNASTPFNKDKLTAILKFGAEELFKDDPGADKEPLKEIKKILKKKVEDKEKKDESYDSSNEDQPRKCGRPHVETKKVVKKPFTDAEIRKLIKSCILFPNPMKRIDAVAGDADLQKKPKSELKIIIQMLYDRCNEALVIRGEPKPKKACKIKEGKSREIIDDKSTYNINQIKIDSDTNHDNKLKSKKDLINDLIKSGLTGSPKKEKKRKTATKTGPVHFTANSEPKAVNLDDIVELPKEKFLELTNRYDIIDIMSYHQLKMFFFADINNKLTFLTVKLLQLISMLPNCRYSRSGSASYLSLP
ncbi:chromodomain-helicase-DNA-binding protein 1-like isoform X2 [Aphis craccivora]|uniref:Chromodomain-helicase-DNA-binding protein 1-like isoform X2 n=1 Tax=Aphis craccivora TaxID=307492 RepID=A0A6G0Y7U5_APHCR|nr:chromodomain-helicase-DNA-binding protein 1-like isoform X2 [Aphis craccivora]